MPVATTPQPHGNIWVAAGEGDIDRVKDLIENEGFSPNVPDPYTYTPMHAAASYGHIHVLEYLLSKGGDVNIKDEDNETPLFTVESIDVARWLVEHGASISSLNSEGITPAQHLAEEFPSISTYLYSLDPSSPPPPSGPIQPSNYTTDQAASQLTQSLLDDAQAILQRAEAEGIDPEEELREIVGRAVVDGVVTGAGWTQHDAVEDGANENGRRRGDESSLHNPKRPRFDEAGR